MTSGKPKQNTNFIFHAENTKGAPILLKLATINLLKINPSTHELEKYYGQFPLCFWEFLYKHLFQQVKYSS